jgi:hypothetical protein
LLDKFSDVMAALAAGAPAGGQAELKDTATVPVSGQVPVNVMVPDKVALSGGVSTVSLSSQAMVKNMTDESDNTSKVLTSFI